METKPKNTPVRPNSLRAWVLAARPKTLSAAFIPVLLGSALAWSDGTFKLLAGLLCMLFAFLMQIDANLINDLYDYLKGSDRSDRLGPQRACAQGWIDCRRMKYGILCTTLAAAAAGLCLLLYGGGELILIGAVCIVFAFLYTTGPYPLAYHGWGDLLVLFFFGFVPVGGTYYVMSHSWTTAVFVVSLACGTVIDTLLMVNNFRDREQDALSGKRTLVVRWGEKTGQRLYLLLGLIAVLLCLYFLREKLWYAAFLPWLYVPLHAMTWRKMVRIGQGRELNAVLGETSRNMLLFGLLLALGLFLG